MDQALAAPERAAGVELLGPLDGGGYQQENGLVRRSDGQTLQLTPLLYRLLGLLDGRRGTDELAQEMSGALGRTVAADDVADLLERLRPLGLLRSADGEEAAAPPAPQPLLGLRFRMVVSDPVITRRVTAPFAQLFRPFVVLPVLAGFLAVCWFVLVDKGLASAAREALLQPELLLAVFALTVVSAGFHEFGHAAACRYGGATPGAMGAALYIVWPAFYTDVNDSYRLSRWGRIRVDLGGLYFNALVAVAVTGAWVLWRKDALLLCVATQLLQMLRQLTPVVRADGYHLLADITGVPDLFRHIGPTLRRLLPSHWHDESALSRKARWVITGWTLVVVPLLVSSLLAGVLLLPRLVATAWVGGRAQVERMSTLDPVVLGSAGLKLLALLLPVFAISFMAGRVVARLGRWVWRRTEGKPAHRALSLVAAGLLLLGLLWAWWPQGQYTPVRQDEHGRITSLSFERAPAPPAPLPRAASATRARPALVLVPRSGSGAAMVLLPGSDGSEPQAVLTSSDGSRAPGRLFPFALPDAPGPNDTQALAVGDTDGGVVYDVAYAMVTLTDGAPVDATNEAYALASCRDCTTVAVAFQVVFVVGQTDAIAPINTAVAANKDCLACVTAAYAVQLVTTVSEAPDEEVTAKVQAALKQLDDVEGLDQEELVKAIAAVKAEVVSVLDEAGLLEGVTTRTASASATPSSSTTSTATPSGTPTGSPSATPSGSPSPTTSETPTASPSPS